MNIFRKKYLFASIYSCILILFTIYVLLDTFVLKTSYEEVTNDNTITNDSKNITLTDNIYQDDNIEIELKEYYEYDTKIYVADIVLNDSKLLKTAFASDSYGKNIVEKTSSIATRKGAILAINGDYYGVQEKGYVLKNGTIYREVGTSNKDDLVIYEDGSFEIINESVSNLKDLLNEGVYNLLSFGPVLLIDNEIQVSVNEEVGKAKASNPRTAIGIIEPLHYVFVVSDGRTKESVGLSLYELASFMQSESVNLAYNLDGGGSSTMYFNGKVVNNPTSSGKTIKERRVSDIVYIGY